MTAIPVTSGLIGCWDQTVLEGVVDGAAVDAWEDGSGNGNTLSLLVGQTAPVYAADSGDGLSALMYPGDVLRQMTTTTNITPINNSPWTEIVILKRGDMNNQIVTGMGANGARQIADFAAWSDGTFIGHFYGGGNDTLGNSPALPLDGAFRAAVMTYDGATVSVAIDADKRIWTGPLNLVAGPFRLGDGNYALGALRNNSAVRGIALYNRVLSTAEIDSVVDYLSTGWATPSTATIEEAEVTSSAQSAVVSTVRAPGTYQYEVRTFDGEFWSPWSTSKATFTIPATIGVTAASGVGSSVAPVAGQASVDPPAAVSTAAAVVPLHQTQHVLIAPAAHGSASVVVVEPIWTWLNEQAGIASLAQQHVLDTDGWPVAVYEWQVRTFDGEFWSPWSTDTAVFTIPATVAAPPASGSSVASAPSLEPSVTSPTSAGAAAAADPGYSAQHIINAPAAVATAQDVEPEPIWTWLPEVSSPLQYGDLVTPEDWERGTYEVAVRTFDGEFWGPWSTDTAEFFAFPAIRAAAATGTAAAGVPVIDAGVLIPSAAAGADATVPEFVVQIRLEVAAASAAADASAPVYAVEAALFPPAALGEAGVARAPRIRPTRTNVYVMDASGVWQEAIRGVKQPNGTWLEVPETQLIGA